jgi:hypothetical protein
VSIVTSARANQTCRVMSRKILKLASIRLFLFVFLFRASDAVSGQSSSMGTGSPARQVVLLLDINPNQSKVVAVEFALAEGIIEKLREPGNSFSVITFGSNPPTLLKSGVEANDAIAAIRGTSPEQTGKNYFGIYFYDALKLGLDQFGNDTRRKSISEGNDHFPRKTFKETVSRTRQSQILCHAVMVASHSFYGAKGQRYGFDLRRLVTKTRGQYVEVESSRKKVPHAVNRIAENIDRMP